MLELSIEKWQLVNQAGSAARARPALAEEGKAGAAKSRLVIQHRCTLHVGVLVVVGRGWSAEHRGAARSIAEQRGAARSSAEPVARMCATATATAAP